MKSIIMKIVFICLLLATTFFVVSETFLDDYFEKDVIEQSDAASSTRRIYLNLNGISWTSSSAKFFAWVWSDSISGTWVQGTSVGNSMYLFEVNSACTNIIITRQSSSTANWNNVWNRTDGAGNDKLVQHTNVMYLDGWNDGAWGEATSFTVTYNSNGASNTMTNSSLRYGQTQNLKKNTLTKNGYTFQGWDTSSNATKVVYKNEASAQYMNDEKDGNVTLYAVWTPNTYNVAFDANGGTGTMSNQQFVFDAAAKSLNANTYTRSYTVTYNSNYGSNTTTSDTATYSFTGWNTTANGSGTGYGPGGNFKIDVNNYSLIDNSGIIKLFAQWNSSSVTLPTPTRTGYNFVGWYDSASAGNKIGDANGSYIPTANTTLYAHWEAKTYSVALDGNGATTAGTTSVTATYDAPMPTPIVLPKKTGYNFNGYWTSTSGGTQYYKADGTSAKNWDKDGATTLYAQWIPIKYTVKYNGNGATGGSTADSSHTYDAEKNLTVNGFSRSGYTFNGWNTKADGSGTPYADGATVLNLTTTDGATLTLYAQWDPITYTLVFNKNNDAATGIMDSQTVTYDVSTPLNANKFALTNHIFGGWYLNESLTGDAYVDGASVLNLADEQDEVVNLYAYWIEPIFTDFVLNYDSFEIDGVDFTQSADIEYSASGTTYTTIYPKTLDGQSKDVPPSYVVPINPNYEFLGWFTTKHIVEGEKPIEKYKLTLLKNNERVTYYAHWSKTPCFVSGDLIIDYYYEKVGEQYEPNILSVGMKFSLNITDSRSNYADSNNKYTLIFYDGMTAIGSFCTDVSEDDSFTKLTLTPNGDNEITSYTTGTFNFMDCYKKEYSIRLMIHNKTEEKLVDQTYTYDVERLVTECVNDSTFDEKSAEEKKIITLVYDDAMHKLLNYDDIHHWGDCSVCGKKIDDEHDLELIKTIGTINYYECKVCSYKKETETVAINISYLDANGDPIIDNNGSTYSLRSNSSTTLEVDYLEKWSIESPSFNGLLPNRPYLSGVAISNESITVKYHTYDVWDGKYPEGEVSFEGSGTLEAPYIINTAHQLAYLQQQSLTNTYAGVYFKLGQSIDLNNHPWKGIGGTSYAANGGAFAGNFDGNGCAIYNVSINATTKVKGFFNCITGYITDLTVIGTAISTADHLGLLAGISYGTIENCYVYGNVTGTEYTGIISGEQGTNDITNCIAFGTVIGTYKVGGLFGSIHGTDMTNVVTISSCINNAEVISIDENTTHDGVGGIVGYTYNYVLFDNCQNNADITSTNMIYSVGGIVGIATWANTTTHNAKTHIENCLNFGTIIGQKGVGGIAGRLNSNSADTYSYIDSCINYGDVIGTLGNTGGIVGNLYDYGQVRNNINNSTITVEATTNLEDGTGGIVGSAGASSQILENDNYANVTSNKLVGGIVGYAKGASTIVYTNRNYATVECTGEAGKEGYAGGIIGKMNIDDTNPSAFENNYNDGFVLNVNGVSYVDSYIGSSNELYGMDTNVSNLKWSNSWSSLETGYYVVLLSSIQKVDDSNSYLTKNSLTSSALNGTIYSDSLLDDSTIKTYAFNIFVDSFKGTVMIKIGDKYLAHSGSDTVDLITRATPFEWKIGKKTIDGTEYEYLYDETSTRTLILSTGNNYPVKAYKNSNLTGKNYRLLQFADITLREKDYTWTNDWASLEEGTYTVMLSTTNSNGMYLLNSTVTNSKIPVTLVDGEIDYSNSLYYFTINVTKESVFTNVLIVVGENSRYLTPASSTDFYAVSDKATNSVEECIWTVIIPKGFESQYLSYNASRYVTFNGMTVGHYALTSLDDDSFAPIDYVIISKNS